MNPERVPVLITGGSTVGLAAAAFLTRQGIRPLLLEQRAALSDHPRATSIGPRAWEALLSAGRSEEFLSVAERRSESKPPIKARSIAEFDPAAAGPPSDVSKSFVGLIRDHTPAFDLGGCGQHQLDPILMRVVEAGGGEVRRSTELLSFEQKADRVIATVRAGEETTVIEADYLIGADGAESRVRELAGIGRDGRGIVGGYHINVLFRADLSELIASKGFFSPSIITHPDAAGMLIALSERNRWCYHIMVPEDGGATPADYTEERCREVIRAGLGKPDQELEILSTSPWRPTSWLADRFREGRVFLAGDSARTLPPVGVFGLTTGICDAYNLAWKLAMVLRGEAGEGLLDSYDAERRPRSVFLTEQVLLRMRHPDLHWGKGTAEDRAAAGIAEHSIAHLCDVYRSAAIVEPRTEPLSGTDAGANLDGSPGTRVPHLELDHEGIRLSTVDLARERFTLLTGQDGTAWTEAASTVAKATGVAIAAFVLDTGGIWERKAGIGPSGALLVRPDGQVAWRVTGDAESPEAVLETAVRQIAALR
ncbi:FAD-dependent monooxygenase [Amycolatopsis sp. NPDC089917]|uniref:FAD-dependent monooxygenase n=1 Tax=Amycolatopsis sp. NPDC089917 TaxID=3155187 RepID=UPI00342817D7